jgi:hypothetical protein
MPFLKHKPVRSTKTGERERLVAEHPFAEVNQDKVASYDDTDDPPRHFTLSKTAVAPIDKAAVEADIEASEATSVSGPEVVMDYQMPPLPAHLVPTRPMASLDPELSPPWPSTCPSATSAQSLHRRQFIAQDDAPPSVGVLDAGEIRNEDVVGLSAKEAARQHEEETADEPVRATDYQAYNRIRLLAIGHTEDEMRIRDAGLVYFNNADLAAELERENVYIIKCLEDEATFGDGFGEPEGEGPLFPSEHDDYSVVTGAWPTQPPRSITPAAFVYASPLSDDFDVDDPFAHRPPTPASDVDAVNEALRAAYTHVPLADITGPFPSSQPATATTLDDGPSAMSWAIREDSRLFAYGVPAAAGTRPNYEATTMSILMSMTPSPRSQHSLPSPVPYNTIHREDRGWVSTSVTPARQLVYYPTKS